MSKSIADQRAELATKIAAQRRWIEEHGGDRAGYIERYGQAGIKEPVLGDGGSAIYAADKAELQGLLNRDAHLLASQTSRTNLKLREPKRTPRPETTRVSYGYHLAPTGVSREERMDDARRDGRKRFPTAVSVVATLDPERPATGPILVEVTIRDSDIKRYYR